MADSIAMSPAEPRQAMVGLDFGTTNSAIAVADEHGVPRLAQFGSGDAMSPTFRSLLYLQPNAVDPELPPRIWAGPEAIERFLATQDEGRLIQSTKSFLASRYFRPTKVFGFEFELEDLISFIIIGMCERAESQLGPLTGTVAVGRPVRFVNSVTETDDEIALGRLETALRRAGFDRVIFEFEPIAAAYHYGSRLERAQVVLIADSGGGTSDFSLLHIDPTGDIPRSTILGTRGIGKAGDDFDARLIRHLVAPGLGRDTSTINPFGTDVPVPKWLYRHLERWHHLSFLKTDSALRVLFELQREAPDPAPFDAFLHLVLNDRGYLLYDAIQHTKCGLSNESSFEFGFVDPPVCLTGSVQRSRFEEWIKPEIELIASCLDDLLRDANLPAADVDSVFLTGGSSFVPSVRRIFHERFEASRIRGGDELTSVASGLCLRARDAQES